MPRALQSGGGIKLICGVRDESAVHSNSLKAEGKRWLKIERLRHLINSQIHFPKVIAKLVKPYLDKEKTFKRPPRFVTRLLWTVWARPTTRRPRLDADKDLNKHNLGLIKLTRQYFLRRQLFQQRSALLSREPTKSEIGEGKSKDCGCHIKKYWKKGIQTAEQSHQILRTFFAQCLLDISIDLHRWAQLDAYRQKGRAYRKG